VRRVKLQSNPKDPEGMEKLKPALERLNQLSIQHVDQILDLAIKHIWETLQKGRFQGCAKTIGEAANKKR